MQDANMQDHDGHKITEDMKSESIMTRETKKRYQRWGG